MNVSISERMTVVETMRYLRVSRSTLSKWRMRKVGPPHHRLGDRLVYYFKHEIDAWVKACDGGRQADPPAGD
jgi:predicted DNA-binding transcriptional regulator AlpA